MTASSPPLALTTLTFPHPRFKAGLEEVARLRLSLFRQFPYLYAGTLEAERAYLQTYHAAGAMLVLAEGEGSEAAGALTALPLSAETEELRGPFERAGYQPAQVLYLGEALIWPQFQGAGLGGRMVAEAEAYARQGGYAQVAAAMVQRPEHHPAKPAGWRSPRSLLERRGYVAQPALDTQMAWPDIDHTEPTPKPMRFWVLELRR